MTHVHNWNDDYTECLSCGQEGAGDVPSHLGRIRELYISDKILSRLVFVDTETDGASPSTGVLLEFGAVHYQSRETLHCKMYESVGYPPKRTRNTALSPYEAFVQFDAWLGKTVQGRPIFVADNLAFDWQWINDGFHRFLGHNPFGYSGRRINDFYAGLQGDFGDQNAWKKLRITDHDHNPVNDAMGNVEAFARILQGER